MKKKILIVLITIVLLVRCTSDYKTSNNPIEVHIKVDKEYFVKHAQSYYDRFYPEINFESSDDSLKEKRFDVSVSIRNRSSKPIYIWLMTCSWSFYFIFNNDYISFTGNNCDNNYPKLFEFKPGERREYHTTLIKSIKFDYPPKDAVWGPQVEETKLGLTTFNDVYLKDDPKINPWTFNKYRNDRSRWTITWSNPLYLLGERPKPKILWKQ
jgi:hypothetical protein